MELKLYILPLLRWWWWILLSMALAAGASYLAAEKQPATYRTKATVMIGNIVDTSNLTPSDIWLAQRLAFTYADAVQRRPVREATQKALGLSVLPKYSAQVIRNTSIIEITVTDTIPNRAQAVANELAKQLTLISPGSAYSEDEQRRDFIDRQLTELEVSIDETEAEIVRQQEALASMFSARQISETEEELQALQAKLTSLRSNYAALLEPVQGNTLNALRIIEQAQTPTIPVDSDTQSTIFVAALVGFFLAALAAYSLHYLDDTFKQPQDVSETLGLTTLAVIPHMKGKKPQDQLIIRGGEQPLAAEAFRSLRTNIRHAVDEKSVQRLLFTSSTKDEGKSITIANLGITLALSELRVILIDGDLYFPSQHSLFDLDNNYGLTSALSDDDVDVESLLKKTVFPGLQLLCAGPPISNSSDLLSSRRMTDLMAKLATMADIILLDGPPTVLVSDASALSMYAHGVILVIKSKSTRRDAAERAVNILEQVNANIIGVVLTQVPPRDSYFHYHKMSYYNTTRSSNLGQSESPGTI